MARAFFAGLIATALAGALLYANARMGVLPQIDLMAQIKAFNVRIGLPATGQAGWATHGVLGVGIFAVAFALIEPVLPGTGWIAGIVFGLLIWLAMMLSFMPLAGHEVLAQDLGTTAVAATLGFNLLYGIVFGLSYAALGERPQEEQDA